MRAGAGGGDTILEAFKPGTAPPDNYAIMGYGGGEAVAVSPEAERAVRTGGGLY